MRDDESWRITRDNAGAGSLLDPPGHPHHYWGVESLTYSGSLQGVVDAEYAPEHIRREARALLEDAELVCSEQWVREVYGYFRNCYSPDGVDRNASTAIIDSSNSLPAERHLAYLLVRSYFPDHEPRVDLIMSGGEYGARKCVKCDQRVQYSAKLDGWAVYDEDTTACPRGGNHE